MKGRNSLILLVACVLTAMVVAPSIYAYNGGVGNGDLEYDCGEDTCHNSLSTCTIAMSASNSTPAPGGELTVWVNISDGGAVGDILGVMIVSATTTSNSLPSNDGWTVLADPSGSTTYNYYEMDSFSESASLAWELSAPSTLGVHILFARVMHGGDGIFYKDFSEGVVFTVTDYSSDGDGVPIVGVPTLVITAPSNSATVSGNLTVNANIVAADGDPVVSATLEIDGVVFGELTEAPFSWIIDTTDLAEGGHRLTVIVKDSTGDTVSKEIAVFVDNESEMISMLEWMVTMGAGAVIIICLTGTLVVVALFIRKRVVDRRAR